MRHTGLVVLYSIPFESSIDDNIDSIEFNIWFPAILSIASAAVQQTTINVLLLMGNSPIGIFLKANFF